MLTTSFRIIGALLLFASVFRSVAQEPQPGLALTFDNGAESSTVIAPNVWLHVKQGDTPDPFLALGKFTATWRGFVSVELRSIYSFQAEVNGSLKLEIGGKPVLDVSGAGGLSEASNRIRLDKGANEIIATYNPAADGDAFVKLLWVPRNTYAQPIPPSELTHLPDHAVTTSGRLHRGRELMLEYRCLNCHTSDDANLPELEMDAPTFDGIGSRRNAAWLAEWIANPHAIRPTARMPVMFHGADPIKDARAVAGYLGTLKTTDELSAEPRGAGSIAAGSELFATLNCAACHNAPGAVEADESKLSFPRVAGKFTPGALSAFLQQPSKHYQWIRMPDFRLNTEEAGQLAAFLLSEAAPVVTSSPVTDPADPGRELVRTSGCLNCHIGPLQNEFKTRTLAELTNWSGGCLAADPVEAAPEFAFSPDDRLAITEFAASGFGSLQRHVDSEFAARQMNNLNCIGCHNHQIDLVPSLALIGGKIKPEYGALIIAGRVDEKPRPWSHARMPGFAATPARGIARGLANSHGFPAETPADGPIDEEMAAVGLKLVSSAGGFSCISCHGIGQAGATQVFESPGINLATSYERLQHDYFTRWILNPLLVDPTSKMPVFFDEESGSPLFEIYDGDGRKQVEALWHYVRAGDAMKIPGGMSIGTSTPVSFEGLE
jgi:mono/diheme cytochrome c family protein